MNTGLPVSGGDPSSRSHRCLQTVYSGHHDGLQACRLASKSEVYSVSAAFQLQSPCRLAVAATWAGATKPGASASLQVQDTACRHVLSMTYSSTDVGPKDRSLLRVAAWKTPDTDTFARPSSHECH